MEVVKLSAQVKALNDLLKSHISSVEATQKDFKGKDSTTKPFLRIMSEKIGLPTIEEKKTIVPIKRIVLVRIVFLKIGTIDTIHDRYFADILLEAKWRDASLNGTKRTAESIDWANYWNPKITVCNAIGEPVSVSDYHVAYDKQGRATVIEKQKITGQFFEFMELNRFPFDKQDLTVTVASDKETQEVELMEDEKEPCSVNHDAFSSAQEWVLGKRLNVWQKTVTRKSNDQVHSYSSLGAAVKVSRRPQFFLWNIVVILFAIGSLAFATFALEMEKPESRMPLTFTLVLTTVTFKLVVTKNLPKISYLTYLDKYILGTMIILVSLCVWHAIAGGLIYNLAAANNSTADAVCQPNYKTRTSTNAGRVVDRVVLAVFLGAYLMFHVIFVVLIVCLSNKKDEGINQEIMETTQNDMDMGTDTGDLLNQKSSGAKDRRRGAGANQEQPNFVIAAFGD
jgi:hypothetical protein